MGKKVFTLSINFPFPTFYVGYDPDLFNTAILTFVSLLALCKLIIGLMLQTRHFTTSQATMTWLPWLPWWPLVFPELIDTMVVAFLHVIPLEVTSGRWVEGCPCSVSLIRQERAFKWFSSVINGPIEGHQQALHYYPKTTRLTLHNMMVLCIQCVGSGKRTKVPSRHTC